MNWPKNDWWNNPAPGWETVAEDLIFGTEEEEDSEPDSL
ncbi:hypothetical protein SEA_BRUTONGASTER_98 [Gordonia phage BrutonGaster]|uniref:Uncharacterized protein n=1 Tax=Gordonia phage BrutonGaster TaxID=2530116 RepID=A0A482JKK9_9CAUD|nr:hypothetical protein HOV26_gp084 [Gordonia phage BrutonGaster]QBP33313.1 hypothetical protein SEA_BRUTONGASTER_98 [Gordonia phage BrutonGaster]